LRKQPATAKKIFRSKRTKGNDVDHGLDQAEWENIVKNRGARSVVNKLMADVSLTTVGDPESMVQYGGPIPEGQTDDVEANAIKAHPTGCYSLPKAKANKGYVEFKFLV
jgi:hypothetical protein